MNKHNAQHKPHLSHLQDFLAVIHQTQSPIATISATSWHNRTASSSCFPVTLTEGQGNSTGIKLSSMVSIIITSLKEINMSVITTSLKEIKMSIIITSLKEIKMSVITTSLKDIGTEASEDKPKLKIFSV